MYGTGCYVGIVARLGNDHIVVGPQRECVCHVKQQTGCVVPKHDLRRRRHAQQFCHRLTGTRHLWDTVTKSGHRR